MPKSNPFANPFEPKDISLQDQLDEQFSFHQDALTDFIEQVQHDNALVNLHSGLGEAGKDLLNPSSLRISPVNLTPWQRTLWRHNSFIFGNLVEILPAAMCSKFITYSCNTSNSNILSAETQARLEKIRPLIERSINQAVHSVEGRVSEFSLSDPVNLEQTFNSQASDLPTSNLHAVSVQLQSIIEEMLVQGESGLKMTLWMQKKLKAIKPFIQEALEESREQGGAGIVLFANDGSTGIDKPLDLDSLWDIDGYNVLSSEDLIASSYNQDASSKDYGKVETYQVNFNSADNTSRTGNNIIHASRVIAFHGRRVNKKLRRINNGWGYSVMDRAFIPITNFIQGSNCIASSLQSFSQTVLFIHDLAKKIAAGKKEQVKEHVRTIAFLRHALGILALDGEHEKYEILSRNYANIEKVLEHLAQMAAGSCDLPLSLLLNRTSSDALNSALVSNNTGGGNQSRQDWSDYVFTRQGSDMLPQIEDELIPILHACKSNPLNGNEPTKWQVTREPIFVESPEQQAKTKEILSRAIAYLLDRGVLTQFGVANALATGVDIFSTIDLTKMLQDQRIAASLSNEVNENVVANRINETLSLSNSQNQSTREYQSQQQSSAQQGEQGAGKSSPQNQV
jgi:phage-related protein (TIGR01555 family)